MKGIIIGGGIIGLSLARELNKNGYDVTVIELLRVGRGASWTAGGMLAPQAEGLEPGTFLDFCIESREMYETFVKTLERETDIDVGYWKCGILCPAFSEEEEKELKKRIQVYSELGLTGKWIDREALEGRYRSLGEEIRGGALFPDDAQVDNRLLMTALEKYARSRGIQLLEFTEASEIIEENGKFEAVRTSKGIVEGDFCVIAAGAWSEHFIKCHVFPIKGEMAAIDISPQDIDRVIFGSKAYLIPRKDYKRLVIGATEEMVGFKDGNTVKGILQLFNGLKDTLPNLINNTIQETWFGYRPATPDLLPVLGKTEIENLYIATGHYRNGILLAPITARVMFDLIDKGIENHYIKEFSLNRFKANKNE
ncbi:glycine oxidase [Persephonella hydrogeniphila]|uniref:Glycine oxidase n=1 Tax=Persephonella hydrogeniphila TaxID=198703 RepID=A0A285MZ83_9AQUI|nr:glycine oxidase ThiO [Persephonella hydrogeniphila]SNZ02408.1 glycine oxidase [Persephonella hydrogeniphila]